MNIRRALPDEAGQLTALAMLAKAHWGYSAAQMAAWRSSLCVAPSEIAAQPCFVCEDGEGVRGFYLLHTDDPWRLEHLWVHPDAMRRGIGRALVLHAMAQAQAGGQDALLVESDPNAEAFYLSCGATRTHLAAAPIAGQPGRQLPHMRLPL